MEIKFKRDTIFRNLIFTPESFAHPAKMDAQLLIWIVERYTKPGDVIVDPMAGSGTTMLACPIGRHIILVELESRFIDMEHSNWAKVKTMPQLGYSLGSCLIIQGDARELSNIFADHVIFSPPYAKAQEGAGIAKEGYKGNKHSPTDLLCKRSYMPDAHGTSEGQIGNFPYGNTNSIIISPPYESGCQGQGSEHHLERMQGTKTGLGRGYISQIIASPPYERTFTPSKQDPEKRLAKLKQVDAEGVKKGSKWATTSEEGLRHRLAQQDGGYGSRGENIGNLRGQSYLSAMLQVYQQCNIILKPHALMILVTKNFIRDKKEVRLDQDTIKLCEQAGFELAERHYRKLSMQSFWRRIYKQKYPETTILDKEDILIFRKQ